MIRKVIVNCSIPSIRKKYEDVDVTRLKDIVKLLEDDGVVVNFDDYKFYEGTTRSEFSDMEALLPTSGFLPDRENPDNQIPTTDLYFRMAKKNSKTESGAEENEIDMKIELLRVIRNEELEEKVKNYFAVDSLNVLTEEQLNEALHLYLGIDVIQKIKECKYESDCEKKSLDAKLKEIDNMSDIDLLKYIVYNYLNTKHIENETVKHALSKLKPRYINEDNVDETAIFEYLDK